MLAKKLTPLLKQYLNIKQQYNDCLIFFRLGDFYELFFEDAETAAKVLGITLTKRGKVDGEDIPMCGVPHHHGDNYLAKLLKNGFKVAICEQIETPEETKKRGYKEIIKRKVVRIATPGTLTEEKELVSPANNYLMSIINFQTYFNIVYADISTGEITLKKVSSEKETLEFIDSISPSELIIINSKEYDFILKNFKKKLVTFIEKSYLEKKSAFEYFKLAYGKNKNIRNFKFEDDDIIALGVIIRYISFTQNEKIPALLLPYKNEEQEYLEIDNASKKNLEIIKTLHGEHEGSLFHSLNFTLTANGSRKLLNDLSNPLSNLKRINKRLELVDIFYINFDFFQLETRKLISNFPDISRALNRLSLGRGGPKDLFSICKGLDSSINLCKNFSDNIKNIKSNDFFISFIELTENNHFLKNIIYNLKNALGENLPLFARDGNFVKEGFDQRLDEIRKFRDEAKKLIIEEEKKERNFSGINSLKIKYNSFLGYFIDITNTNNNKIDKHSEHYIHRQTLKNSFRYTTKNLIIISEKILNANFKSLELENQIYNNLVDLTLKSSESILKIASIIARIDVALSWATYARKFGAVKPSINTSYEFDIEEGRHPSVEKTHSEGFIANTCVLNNNNKVNYFRLITGPNMSGKSTYLRQNALILIIAQAGGYCPAKKVNIGLCDKLYCRVGFGDELARGNSTFMVEMLETANILNTATDRSLVILDEIGRGTSTYDGMSLAWATIEYLIENIKCKTLFATHYNQLATLEKDYPQLKLNTFKVKKWNSDLIFLHQITEGVAESSYGIQVAKMAGLPEEVILSAKKILKNLENKSKYKKDFILQETINFIDEKETTLLDNLKKKISILNLDSITPIGALNFLKEIKDQLEEDN